MSGRRTAGFIGTGHMGRPMVARLLDAGTEVVVWARRPERLRELAEMGAIPAVDVTDLWARCDTVCLMLANAGAVDEVLGWDGTQLAVPVSGRTLINLGTISPEQSEQLHVRVTSAGGRYVEAPVSGSRVPAERGELVLLLAGDDLDGVQELLRPLCTVAYECGPVPNDLAVKLAVNTFLITLVTGLAETVRVAESRGVDLGVLQQVLDAGPMASAVSSLKLVAMLDGDYPAQATVADVRCNCRLVLDMAASSGAVAPLMRVALRMFDRALGMGLGDRDMAAVLEAFRAEDPRSELPSSSTGSSRRSADEHGDRGQHDGGHHEHR
jgi:3-hydroxyisobutyrate dehydrogenase